jgi:predicted Zn-dependent peptidase
MRGPKGPWWRAFRVDWGTIPRDSVSARLPVPYDVARDRLPNGIRLCTVEAPYLHWSTVAVYARAGSRYETPTSNGLSHFVEHMLFRGSARFPNSYMLNRAIEEKGGTLYAETGRDYSLYQISLHPSEVGAALEILGDLFAAPTFRDIDLERSIILEELLEDFDERGRNVNIDDLSRMEAWQGHPLGYSIAGPAKNVRRFGVPDVRRHFQRFYGGHNLVLCVAGRVNHARVRKMAGNAFQKVSSGRRAVPRAPKIVLAGPRFRSVWSDSAQSQLQVLFYALPEADPDYPALVTLLRILDDGMSTRLHYRVCDQKGLAYNCSASLEPLFDTALIEIDAACAHAKLPDLVIEVLQILGEFRTDLVSSSELEKAKSRYLCDLEAGFDDLDGLAGWFGGTELFFRPYSHAQRVARMQKVTAKDVHRVAQRLLRRERLTAVALGALDRATARKVRRLLEAF